MIEWLNSIITMEFWTQMLDQIADLGMIAGIGLPMIEAFFPPLPLFVFVTINIFAFGFWLGYLYSWLGSCIGSILVFLLIKKFGRQRFEIRLQQNEKLRHIFYWIKQKGFTPIFFLLVFPFTPSIAVCGLAALAGIKNREYFCALVLGKLIMIFSLSFIGVNITAFLEQPLKSMLLILITVAVSFAGKYILQRWESKNRAAAQERYQQIKVS